MIATFTDLQDTFSKIEKLMPSTLLECTHPNIDAAETQKGDCACGCRDYRFCPDCDESVEVA